MNKFFVLGNPIKHSISPYVHKKISEIKKIKIFYKKFLTSRKNLYKAFSESLLNKYYGFNITLPFKYISSKLTNFSEKKKSFNLLKNYSYTITLYCTDNKGFFKRKRKIIKKKILLIGYGGTAKSIIPYINKFVYKIYIYIRKNNNGINIFDINVINFDIVIDTTSSLIFKKTPCNFFLKKNSKLISLNYKNLYFYNFYKNIVSGIGMLINQAIISFNILNLYKKNDKNEKRIIKLSQKTYSRKNINNIKKKNK
ncbi:hypothetical protein [Candidatus Vidania fulgoroideorum]